MMGVARTVERVQGIADERGWGFRTFLKETPILIFLATGSVMNLALSILLASLPVNKACYGSCGNIGNVIFFRSNGYISSSSSESFFAGDFFFYTFEPKLNPTPSSLPFFFSSSVRKM
jgi:hypothetical protein